MIRRLFAGTEAGPWRVVGRSDCCRWHAGFSRVRKGERWWFIACASPEAGREMISWDEHRGIPQPDILARGIA